MKPWEVGIAVAAVLGAVALGWQESPTTAFIFGLGTYGLAFYACFAVVEERRNWLALNNQNKTGSEDAEVSAGEPEVQGDQKLLEHRQVVHGEIPERVEVERRGS